MRCFASCRRCIFAPRSPRRWPLARVGLSFLLPLTVVSCKGPEAPATSEPTGALRSAEASSAAPAAGRVETQLLTNLFTALRAGDRAFPPEIEALLSGKGETAREDPNWPTLTYLLGEAHRQRGEIEQARVVFRELASWAASNHPAGPYGDTWGGSGLAVLGLWRWLQILDEHGPTRPEEVGQVLEVASNLQETRFYSGMVQTGLLPAMPLLEENVAERLAHVAWKNQRPEATSLFLDFLTIDSRGELDAIDKEIKAEILRRHLADPERLELFRARRLLSLVKTQEQKDRAAEILKGLWENPKTPPDVRAEAGYAWANYKRRQPDRRETLAILTEVIKLADDRPLAEEALYLRGTVYNREDQKGDTAPRNVEAFRADMLGLLRRFPRSRLADDALFQLATDYLFEPDLDNALPYFEKLRGFQGRNDWQDSAYYLPALGLVGRGRDGDLDAAKGLLDEYVKRYPDGVFRLRCLFWLGRIAEQRSEPKRAQDLFRQVIDEGPYDYYALRARMHLEEGAGAIKRDLPRAGSQTQRELYEAYKRGRVDIQLARNSPYHDRLRVAASTGLYRQLLEIDKGLVQRLDDIPLERLDARGLTPAAALLLALRQDALAAKDSDPTADNWLRLAGLLGYQVQDWPTAIEMSFVRSGAPQQRLTELQKDPRYLATAYPDPANLKTLEQPLARAAWPIDNSTGLSQSLMYAVIRHESRFYPEAISREGALGLFQFMPWVFDGLNRRWKLLHKSGARSDTEYLLDPGRNTELWARWVNDEFSLEHRDGIAMALMKHHAGSGNVGRWSKYWKKLGPEDDLEYRIETARFNETRNFVHGALRDTAIVDAAKFFEGRPGR